jgi:4,5:9,10-diseco-3-hydroxy-5,9,17-trioxoandrosta-1(10),2-diene-4-oate hydrolase
MPTIEPKRWAAGAQEGLQMVEADGVRMAVARTGSGPPVVCLHAIGHGARDFEAFAQGVGDRFEVIAIDWPGQGRSEDDAAAPASAARYADLLAIVLQKLGIEAPILLGCSVGGAAAMLYAARAPVRGLVLCDTGGLVAVDATVRRFCGAFASFFAAGARGVGWYRALFGLYYSQVLPAPAARAQRRRIVEAAYETAPVLVQAWTSFAQPEADLRGVAAALDIPVWFAWAKGDKVISLARCRPAIAEMKHATVTEFRGGHAAFLEQPQAFAEAFVRFADALPALSARPGPRRAA